MSEEAKRGVIMKKTKVEKTVASMPFFFFRSSLTRTLKTVTKNLSTTLVVT